MDVQYIYCISMVVKYRKLCLKCVLETKTGLILFHTSFTLFHTQSFIMFFSCGKQFKPSFRLNSVCLLLLAHLL